MRASFSVWRSTGWSAAGETGCVFCRCGTEKGWSLRFRRTGQRTYQGLLSAVWIWDILPPADMWRRLIMTTGRICFWNPLRRGSLQPAGWRTREVPVRMRGRNFRSTAVSAIRRRNIFTGSRMRKRSGFMRRWWMRGCFPINWHYTGQSGVLWRRICLK